MSRLRRVLPLVLAFAAIPVAVRAQPSPVTGITGGETFRLRNLVGGGAAGEELYLGLLSGLSAGSTRDAYNGSWAASGAETTIDFVLTWRRATGTLSLDLGSAIAGVTRPADVAAVASTWSGSTFSFTGMTGFDAVRLYGRSTTATVDALTFEALTGAMAGQPRALVGSGGLTIGNVAQAWSVDASMDFLLTGTLRTATCTGEGCRLEIGVGSVPTAAVPEPGALAMVTMGATGLLVASRRRRA
jgi:hypothetical protein